MRRLERQSSPSPIATRQIRAISRTYRFLEALRDAPREVVEPLDCERVALWRPRLRRGGLEVCVKKEKAAPGGATFVCLGWIPRLSDGGRGRRASCDKPVHRCA